MTKSLKAGEVHPTVVRLSQEMRSELQRQANINDRSLSKEISVRLSASLSNGYSQYQKSNTSAAIYAQEGPSQQQLQDIDIAMLEVFRRLPAEKQLALLSLFK